MDQENQLSLNDRQFAICKELYHVNQLTPFPVSDDRIVEWAKSIEEILPQLDINHLRELFVDFKLGKISYDKNDGIQNIFMGLVAKFGMIYDK